MTDFKSAVAEVKLAYNLVDYIQAAGVRLKQNGSTYKGLCPFHSEKTPSFNVNAHFQNYKCFGCGVSGDILQFVQKYEHLEFFDALKKLAEDKNIKLDLKEERSGVDYSSLRECMRTISNFFFNEFKKLDPSHPAKQEVVNRGFAKSKILHGYAPEGRQTLYKHLKAKGFSDEVILLTGACIQFEGKSDIFDFWHGRLMFFITDITGKPIGWSGRKLYETDNRGKYVNSKDGVLFDKSASLYHVSQAKKMASETKTIYVNEGQFDVEALAFAGLENAVASSGTAFTEKQAMILRRLVSESGKIVFCFDGDKAGRTAAQKVFTTVPIIHSQAYVVALPEGQDPCDYRLEHGNEALVELLRQKEVPLVEFVLAQVREAFDLNKEVEKTKYVAEAAAVLKTVASDVLRESYTKQVSLESFTSIDVVRRAISDAKPLTKDYGAPSDEAPVVTTSEEEKTEELLSAEKVLEAIQNDEAYTYASRLLALAFANGSLKSLLSEAKPHTPMEFHGIIDEYLAYPEGLAPIAERFTESELAHMLIVNDYFPFEHLMTDEQRRDLFVYLSEKLSLLGEERRQRAVRAKVGRVLQKSPEQGADFLARALKAEEKALAEEAR